MKMKGLELHKIVMVYRFDITKSLVCFPFNRKSHHLLGERVG